MLARLAENEVADIFTPDAGKFGPKMAALPPRMQRFVLACLSVGEKMNHTKAAEMAGYEAGKAGSSQLKVQGHRLAHDIRVREALLEMAGSHFQASTLMAAMYLTKTVADSSVDHGIRVKAAIGILDRGGLHAKSEHNVNVTHTDNRAEKLLKLAELAKAAGQDPRAVLGELADVTDVEFKMVADKSPDPEADADA